jgi:membrane carboxypeptidase/penicillin-binding protein PbpC
VNEKGKVMEVAGDLDNENQNIQIYNRHGRINQQWEVIYADQYPEEPVKGELNSDFGIYVERDFYVVSELDSHRYLDLINNRNMVIKTSNGRNTQKWYFDQKTLTIKTRLNNQSWDVKSSGKSSSMQIWSTNSQWF